MYIAFLAVIGSAISSFTWRFPIRCEKEWQLEAQNILKSSTPSVSDDIQKDSTLPPSFTSGRSVCPSCNHTLGFLDLIPVISFILNKGRCRHCNNAVSKRYPFVELGFVFIGSPLILLELAPLEFVCTFLILLSLFVATVIDIENKWIPDECSLIVIACAFIPAIVNHQPLVDNVLGLILGYSLIYLLRFIYLCIRKVEAIGLGDAKLLAAIGAWLGFSYLPYLLMLAATIGILYALVMKMNRTTQIPFGPFLAASSISLYYVIGFLL